MSAGTAALGMGPALLFCPGDRPDRFQKAADRSDAVILDLEDAVGAETKAAARAAIVAADLDPARTIVRVQGEEAIEGGHAVGVCPGRDRSVVDDLARVLAEPPPSSSS